MSLRVSPISRTAAILIIVLGAFTLFAGYVADVQVNEIVGAAIIALGVVMYRLLFMFTRKVESEVRRAESA